MPSELVNADFTRRVVVTTDPAGPIRLPLHLAPDTGESVTLEQVLPGAHLTEADYHLRQMS